MNTFDKFTLAERAEEIFADIYRLLAQYFEDEPTYQSVFLRLEDEEIQHAMRIKMLRKRYLTTGKDVTSIAFNVEPLQAFLKDGETLKQRLKSREKLKSFADITRVVANLERQFAGAHAEMILGVTDSSLRKFFERLAEQDRGHAALLRASVTTQSEDA